LSILSIFSFITAIAVLVFGLRLASEDLTIFLDYPSMFIVLGGTLASTAISFRLNRMYILIKVFFIRVLRNKGLKYNSTITDMVEISDSLKKGSSLDEVSKGYHDFFFKEAVEIIQDGVIKDDEIISILEERNETMVTFRLSEANKIKVLSKFAPAFGMIGTTIGMIVLLANLGGEDAMKLIGPAMGVCLITTLYGAVLANLFFTPIAENLIDSAKENFQKNKIIIKGVMLIQEKANPIIVAEKLNSMVPPLERVIWKDILQQKNTDKKAA